MRIDRREIWRCERLGDDDSVGARPWIQGCVRYLEWRAWGGTIPRGPRTEPEQGRDDGGRRREANWGRELLTRSLTARVPDQLRYFVDWAITYWATSLVHVCRRSTNKRAGDRVWTVEGWKDAPPVISNPAWLPSRKAPERGFRGFPGFQSSGESEDTAPRPSVPPSGRNTPGAAQSLGAAVRLRPKTKPRRQHHLRPTDSSERAPITYTVAQHATGHRRSPRGHPGPASPPAQSAVTKAPLLERPKPMSQHLRAYWAALPRVNASSPKASSCQTILGLRIPPPCNMVMSKIS